MKLLLLARIHRWFHILIHFFNPNHASADFYDDKGNILALGCICGKFFYPKGQNIRTKYYKDKT